jgi:hypothetical protein
VPPGSGTHTVTVPRGFGPGQELVQFIDGQLVVMTVPAGSSSGSTLHIQIPPARPSTAQPDGAAPLPEAQPNAALGAVTDELRAKMAVAEELQAEVAAVRAENVQLRQELAALQAVQAALRNEARARAAPAIAQRDAPPPAQPSAGRPWDEVHDFDTQGDVPRSDVPRSDVPRSDVPRLDADGGAAREQSGSPAAEAAAAASAAAAVAAARQPGRGLSWAASRVSSLVRKDVLLPLLAGVVRCLLLGRAAPLLLQTLSLTPRHTRLHRCAASCSGVPPATSLRGCASP